MAFVPSPDYSIMPVVPPNEAPILVNTLLLPIDNNLLPLAPGWNSKPDYSTMPVAPPGLRVETPIPFVLPSDNNGSTAITSSSTTAAANTVPGQIINVVPQEKAATPLAPLAVIGLIALKFFL